MCFLLQDFNVFLFFFCYVFWVKYQMPIFYRLENGK